MKFLCQSNSARSINNEAFSKIKCQFPPETECKKESANVSKSFHKDKQKNQGTTALSVEGLVPEHYLTCGELHLY